MQQRGRLPSPDEHQLSSAATGECDVIANAFDDVHDLVNRGDLTAARLLCAATLRQYQPHLAWDHALLVEAIAALLAAQAFQQLGRLIAAVAGWQITVTMTARTTPGFTLSYVPNAQAVLVTVNAAVLTDRGKTVRWSKQIANAVMRQRRRGDRREPSVIV